MAFPFRSSQFGGAVGIVRQKLDDCATKDPAHLIVGTVGEHVTIVQDALIQLGQHSFLDAAEQASFELEFQTQFYGNMTAKIVQNYKNNHTPKILQPWQSSADNVVGKQTIRFLDDDMAALEGRPPVPEKKATDIFIFFSGVQDGPPAGEPLGNDALGHGFLMRPIMQSFALSRPNGKFLAIGGALTSDRESAGIRLATRFLRDNVSDPPGKHVIYGFSAGGTNSLNLSLDIDKLNALRAPDSPKLRIDMLVTIDASTRTTSSVSNPKTVGGCVKRSANYFQQEIRPQGDGVGGSPHMAGRDRDAESPRIFPNVRLSERELRFPLPGQAHQRIEEVTLDRSLGHFREAFF
jgi:hypothetical protein